MPTFRPHVLRIVLRVLFLRLLLLATMTTVPLTPVRANEPTVRRMVRLTLAFRAVITFGPTSPRNTPVETQLVATGSRMKVLLVKMMTLSPLLAKPPTTPLMRSPSPRSCDGIMLRVSTEPSMLTVSTTLTFVCPLPSTPSFTRGSVSTMYSSVVVVIKS